MSAQSYTDEQVEERRAWDLSTVERRWLATVDALRERVESWKAVADGTSTAALNMRRERNALRERVELAEGGFDKMYAEALKSNEKRGAAEARAEALQAEVAALGAKTNTEERLMRSKQRRLTDAVYATVREEIAGRVNKIVDGITPEQIMRIVETEVTLAVKRHRDLSTFQISQRIRSMMTTEVARAVRDQTSRIRVRLEGPNA